MQAAAAAQEFETGGGAARRRAGAGGDPGARRAASSARRALPRPDEVALRLLRRGAAPGRAAGAHRVLRHLAHLRHVRRRLDGALHRRPARQGPVPPLPDQELRRQRRLPRHDRGRGPPLPAARARKQKPFPDLVVIDGGRGQVAAALKAFLALDLAPPPLIGLAKEHETIVFPDERPPLNLPLTHPGLQLLQRLRDEAHRFANTYNADLRSRKIRESVLDDFPGLGPVRRRGAARAFRLDRPAPRRGRRRNPRRPRLRPEARGRTAPVSAASSARGKTVDVKAMAQLAAKDAPVQFCRAGSPWLAVALREGGRIPPTNGTRRGSATPPYNVRPVLERRHLVSGAVPRLRSGPCACRRASLRPCETPSV